MPKDFNKKGEAYLEAGEVPERSSKFNPSLKVIYKVTDELFELKDLFLKLYVAYDSSIAVQSIALIKSIIASIPKRYLVKNDNNEIIVKKRVNKYEEVISEIMNMEALAKQNVLADQNYKKTEKYKNLVSKVKYLLNKIISDLVEALDKAGMWIKHEEESSLERLKGSLTNLFS